MNQRVMFFSDGGTDIREVQLYLNPEAEHYLDWFHLTMRLTVMGQYAKGDLHGILDHGSIAGESGPRLMPSTFATLLVLKQPNARPVVVGW